MTASIVEESPAAQPRPDEPRFGPWRRELRSFLELFALTGIAVAQPALDLLTKNTELFITLHSSKLDTIALTLFVVLVPPLALWAVEVLIGLALPRLRRYAHALLAAGVVAVFAVEVLKKQTDFAPSRLVIVALVLGIGGGALVLFFHVVRLFLRYLAIAPVIFAVLFLFASPVTAVVFEGGTGPAKNVHVGKPKRVVMLVFDEFPLESILDGTGHVDATLFPHFAALSTDSTWFRNETTVAPYTEAAVPAILTGDYPTGTDTAAVAAKYPRNLFTLLGGTYRMNVHEAITRLCPTGICEEPSSGSATSRFADLIDSTESLWEESASPRRPPPVTLNVFHDPLVAGNSFVRSLEPERGPQLDFLHVMLPHQPWHLRGTGQDDEFRQRVIGLDAKLAWIDDWDALSGRQRHLLQAQAADRLLGQVVAKLKRIGAYEQSLIVVTADHGVAFTKGHSIRGVANQTYPQIMWTPMFIRAPGQAAGVVDDHAVRSIDVLPTIADILDTKLPWKVDGHSMLGPERAVGEPRMFQWIFNDVNPPPGRSYMTFPGKAGFAAALTGQASTFSGAADLRLYRIGPFGDLIGRPAAPLVTDTTPASVGRLQNPSRFNRVVPTAPSIPWAFVRGNMKRTTLAPEPLAITVNGVIAGLSQSSVRNLNAKRADFWSTLPPQLYRSGHNTIGLYIIRGTPAAPTLVPVQLK